MTRIMVQVAPADDKNTKAVRDLFGSICVISRIPKHVWRKASWNRAAMCVGGGEGGCGVKTAGFKFRRPIYCIL